jgi:hypothetical protein
MKRSFREMRGLPRFQRYCEGAQGRIWIYSGCTATDFSVEIAARGAPQIQIIGGTGQGRSHFDQAT